MKQSMRMEEAARSSSASTAAIICTPLCTLIRFTPGGASRPVGPETSVTCAPACRQARASAYPILPEERLVMPRTGSIGSKVGPAVISTRLPDITFGAK
jgi:hypothetical protein